MVTDFLKGFWGYVSGLTEWWQGAILICTIVFILVIGKFWRNIISWIGNRIFQETSEAFQYRMFWGLTNDAIHIKMKDEIRRSFKENGYQELSGNDFAQYVKNQSKILISILKSHFINLYPDDKRIKVKMEDILGFLEKQDSKIEDIIFEMYIESKRIKKQDNDDLLSIDEKFEKEIETFIKKKNSGDCKQCFIILFGKREIAENKKSKIKTLKTQMNFAEQKLSEIHSNFLSFYSEFLNKRTRREVLNG